MWQWQWILALILTLASPSTTQRELLPIPEPDIRDDMRRVYLPFVAGAPESVIGADVVLYGYASPHRRTYDVPFYNWRAIPGDCQNENFWPMVRGQAVDPAMVDACDDGQRMLLVYNEPELDHYSATPQEAALFVRDWADRWSGSIACCGNYYANGGGTLSGVEWFLDFVTTYQAAYGELPPLTAIHLHVYEQRTLDTGALRAWRIMANVWGWQIIVSESGTFPTEDYLPADVAARLPAFLAALESELQPSMVMWFSDYLQPGALGDGTAWHHFNLTEIDGALTPVGEAWEAHTGRRIVEDR